MTSRIGCGSSAWLPQRLSGSNDGGSEQKGKRKLKVSKLENLTEQCSLRFNLDDSEQLVPLYVFLSFHGHQISLETNPDV